jgi:hypothetical protein
LAASMVLMTVHGSNGAPSLAEAAGELGVSVADVDDKFGVVPVNPDQSLYAVQVKESSIATAQTAREGYRGPYSNPVIAPLGPVQPGEKEPDGGER